MSKDKCKVDDCEGRASYPSVLCRGHAKDYAKWRDRVDLSTVKGETSLTYWLEHGDAPTPKRLPRKGEVIVWVIGARVETSEQETREDLSVLKDCARDPVSVRVKSSLCFDSFVGSIIYGADEEGFPYKYRAIDGWYGSRADALDAMQEVRAA